MTNDALLEQIRHLLDQHGRAIAELQEQFVRYDALYGTAIRQLHERFDAYELWAKEVLALLRKMDGKT